MTIGMEIDFDRGLSIEEWLKNKSTGDLQRKIEQRIVEFLFNQDSDDLVSQQIVFQLAWIGSKSENRPLLEREIAHLIRTTSEWKVQQVGGIKHSAKKISSRCKRSWDKTCAAAEKVGNFVAEHKVEILAGVAICAIGIGIAAATGYTLTVSVAGVAVAGASSVIAAATEKAEPPRIPQVPPPSAKEELAIVQQTYFFNLPKLELPSSLDEILVTADGVWANGIFYSTTDLMKHSHFENELAKSGLTCIPPTKETRKEDFGGIGEAEVVPPESTEAVFPIENYFRINDSVALVQNSSAKFFDPSSLERKSLVSVPFLIPGEKNTNCKIGWINGIGNSFNESIDNAAYIQRLASGHTIQGIYNCSHTPAIDLLEAAILNHQGFSPITAKLLQNQWREFHEANRDRPNAKFLQICHSQGYIHVRNGLEGAPQEIRDRVIVIAIAPAAVVPKRLCFQSYNYASQRDFVYKLEPSTLTVEALTIDDVLIPTFGEPINHLDELIILSPHPDAPKFDHPIQSPTFQRVLKDLLADYKQHEGEYMPGEKGKK